MSDFDLATQYLERFGVLLNRDFGVSEIFEVMDSLLLGRSGVFLLKIDGERVSRRYTFVYTEQVADVVIRKDADTILDGAVHVFAELERAKVLPVIIK